ncbi:MAG: SDR family oxidoreductase [Alphaproteobacteria bacterium]|nr:SDR family oxidoreductase [Alphaproteobacteria bacterium]
MTTVLITGANRGLGLEFARQYAADGWKVVGCCRDPDKADALKKITGVQIEALETGDEKSIAALAAKLKDTPIDLLINNAGIYSGANGTLGNDASQTFGTINGEAWDKVLRVNTIAPILVTQALLPNLQKGAGKKIVNITSRMGSLTEMGAGSVAYRSSKTALNGAMRVIMHDLQNMGLSIYNFHPGWVQTDMGGKGAHLTPEQSITAMRATISKLTAKDSGHYLNYDGQIIPW